MNITQRHITITLFQTSNKHNLFKRGREKAIQKKKDKDEKIVM